MLQYFLGGFSAFFVLAVLVIFQPELRRMLAELGNLPLFATAHEQRENIEVIIQTVERLADVRIGALIAIEQSIQLQEAVESGIPVDCEATPEMLETIFFPNNAIHDGGVIIKGDRIAFAACIFPLTQRQDLNKSLGTRHRAAIGLSEETDAVVVVVSEETGAISYAYKGQLVRGVTLEELRAFLTSVLVNPARSRNWLGWIRSRTAGSTRSRVPWRWRRRIRRLRSTTNGSRQMITFLRNLVLEDFWLKLFSLVLAVLIWLTVTFASQKDVRDRSARVLEDLPVTILASAEDVRNFKVSPSEVEVTVQGDPKTLQNLQSKDIRAMVDLTGVEAARDLRKRIEVSVPAGVTHLRVAPEEVQVIFPPDR